MQERSEKFLDDSITPRVKLYLQGGATAAAAGPLSASSRQTPPRVDDAAGALCAHAAHFPENTMKQGHNSIFAEFVRAYRLT